MTYFVLVCLVMGLVTYFTRALPFLFFSVRKPPELMDFLQIPTGCCDGYSRLFYV